MAKWAPVGDWEWDAPPEIRAAPQPISLAEDDIAVLKTYVTCTIAELCGSTRCLRLQSIIARAEGRE